MPFDYESALQKRRASNPSRAYLWCVELPNLAETPSNLGNSTSFNRASEFLSSNPAFVSELDMGLINTLVSSISSPFFSFDTDKVTDANRFWYKAKHNDISTISLTMEEQMNGIVWMYLNNWRQLMIGQDGGYNPPHFYKRDIKIHRLNPAKEIFQTFIYKNYFISEVSAIANDYTTNSPTEYSATFTGDSLQDPMTVTGAELTRLMEVATSRLEGIDISYDRFNDPDIPIDTIARVLTEVSRRAF